MSFKRDGDDISLLNRLRHHRVSELLGSYIPEDEAKLLSNGRLTCLVCTHRPIFDTVNMLAKHRQGQRHLFELSKHIKRNEQLEIQKLKKEQQNHVESCRKAELSISKMNSLLLGPKNQSSSSSNEVKSNNRRKMIKIPEIICKPLLKQSCAEQKKNLPSSNSQLRKYLKKIKKKPQLDELIEKEKSSYSTRTNNVEISEMPLIHASKPDCKQSCTVTNTKIQGENDFSKNLSGWIKDNSGNWMKDPEAEFDTEDEVEEE